LLKDYNFKAIGNFGIGFLACFMLSDRVNIRTKYYNESIVHELDIEKHSKYIVYKRGEKSGFSHGTEIILHYDFEKNSLNISEDKIKEFIESNFLLDTPFINISDLKNTELADTRIRKKLDAIGDKSKVKSGIYIDLAQYFNGISGYIQVKLSKHDFVFQPYDIEYFKTLTSDENIPFLGYYDGSTINKLDETSIAQCVKENLIHLLSFYFVPSELNYEFNKMLEVLEDELEVFKLKDEYFPHIVLLLSNQLDLKNFEKQLIKETDQWPHYQKIKQELDKYENKHNSFYLTKSERNVLRIDSENLNIKLTHCYSYNVIRYLFVKNVFIKDLSFDRSLFFHSSCELGSIVINSTNADIQPNISRNNIDKNVEVDIQYAIMKFCHLFALQYYENDLTKVNQIKHVLKQFYYTKSVFLNYQAMSEIKYSEVINKDDMDELLDL
jgi:molecular chaperone HtpG